MKVNNLNFVKERIYNRRQAVKRTEEKNKK